MRRAESGTVAECVVAAARELLARTAAPERWLIRLAAAFHSPLPVREGAGAGLRELPDTAWHEPSLLGEILAAARDTAAPAPLRHGRAGRVSAGCVYTPAAVAREIVAEVHVGPRRVLDPACGAGVFLLEAFERAYRRRLEGGATPLDAARAALEHELAGVDVDAQALAVAEFSLRLTAFRHSGLADDVPLDLRCQDALTPLAGLEGHCECVVGNPPFIEGRGLDDARLDDLRRRFRCAAAGKVNLFAVFVERALELLQDGGVLAFVLPATFRRNARYRGLREVLLEHTIESITPLSAQAFGGRVVETVVLRVRKRPPAKGSRVLLACGPTLQSRLCLGSALRFCDSLSRAQRRQIEAMERHGVPLSQLCEVRDGISTGFQPFPQRLLGRLETADAALAARDSALITHHSALVFVAADGTRVPFDPARHRKIIDGGEFQSFTPVQWAGRYIEYDKCHEHTPPHPGRPFNCQLRSPEVYDRAEKLLTRQTAKGLIATVDRARYFVRNSVHVTYPKPAGLLWDRACALSLDALCACLNSRLYSEYLLAVTGEDGSYFPQVHIADLRRLPLVPDLLAADGELAALGRELLALHGEESRRLQEIEARKARVEGLLRAAFGLPVAHAQLPAAPGGRSAGVLR